MKLLIIDELRSKGNPAATEIILHSGFNQKNMNLTNYVSVKFTTLQLYCQCIIYQEVCAGSIL